MNASSCSDSGLQGVGPGRRRASRNTKAVTVLIRAAAHGPERAQTWNELGRTYRALGKPAEAIAALQKAIEKDPGMPEAHNNLGALRRSGADFLEAIRNKPNYADAHYNYAMLLGQGGRYEEARRELEASVKADGKFTDAREMLGDFLMASRREADAAGHYREALRQRPDSMRATFGLGAALAATGHRDEALPYLRKAAADPQWSQRATEVLRGLGAR